jgi:hypothetical protein
MCVKHYTRVKRNGTTVTKIGHPSEITISGDVAQIKLCRNLVALVDAKDVPLIEKYKWTFSMSNGVVRNVWQVGKNTNRHVKLHREILQPPADKVVDHINGDKLDNRRCNLRVVDQWQNIVNQSSRPNRNIEKSLNGYCVRLKANQKRYYIGRYRTLEDAKRARDVAAKEIHGTLRTR